MASTNKKGKEFIFPDNVNADYSVFKGLTLKDIIIYAGSTFLGGAILIAIPPYFWYWILIKLTFIILVATGEFAFITMRPVKERPNITAKRYFSLKREYTRRQKLFFISPKKRS